MKRPFLNPRSLAVVDSFGDAIFDALKSLGAREQYAIIRRYGLDRQGPRTYREIADSLGVSIARVQTIERSGLHKLGRLRNHRPAAAVSSGE